MFVFSSGTGDTFSHVGGLLGGMTCGLFLSPLYQNPETRNQIRLDQYSLKKSEKYDTNAAGVHIGFHKSDIIPNRLSWQVEVQVELSLLSTKHNCS